MAAGDRTGWWRGCVIYQVYPRSFQDTTGNGSGDLAGITSRLAHVASLGVDAVWLSPFFKSPMADMGYDVSDYCDVDPMFGTLEDFDALVAEAHRLGLKIVIDQVLSHSSDKHNWFVESRASRDNPKSDWYIWADTKPDGSAPNNWLSVFGGPAWEWDSTRRQYYMHNFLASQPDLNFHNPEVQDALLDTVRFWLERGVDGFRLDTVNYYVHDRWLRSNPPLASSVAGTNGETNTYLYQEHLFDKTQPENLAFLRRFRALLDEYDDRAAVGEIGDEGRSLQTLAAYTSGGDKLHMCYTFDLLGPQFSAAHVRGCVEAFEAAVSDGWVCWAFSNHDVVRHVSRWTRPGSDPDAVARFSIMLLSCLRGSICLYEGEELGLEEAELAYEDLRDPVGIRFWPGVKGRDGCRTPMVWEAGADNAGFSTARPWLPIPASHRARAVDVQNADTASVLKSYRTTLALRGEHEALVSGSIRFLDAEGDVLAFIREGGGERLLCVFNFAGGPANWPLRGNIGAVVQLDGNAAIVTTELLLPALGVFFGRLV
ncbi:alpha-glucosidase family protein [Mesorhizobium sp. M7A.F.Ca.MR.245.00.0.0]|uniref:beta-galactosidase BglA n=1 Tax=Mesorhizobium sp. M7A.F.Ca.MR.245.00.0.0 TaxID=2496778 RepID=UPI000FCAF6EA|nr:alpha-glucosidase family protein [Mesorhizobium sp. M7A.F.Ca.MR.245.00.0.0]RUV22392.1 alpha-glucosidase [Mesorhizobium sp. M7A.F.Ca.MR.245.00.0.0]RUV46682.1 alpha-glucosidase [Mesorhizobium sp. M7A.F.Ca.MR.228.00.0.0]